MKTAILSILTALAAHARAECSKDILRNITADHEAAQIAGKTSFSSLGASVAYTENRKKVDITKGILSQALKIDHSRSQHDTAQCAAFSEFIVTNPAKPYVIVTQFRVDNTTYKVNQIDKIVTSKGDW
jgi:hypothetical protein